jgi:NADPH:quinone reductase-like Zn-dependent oxidoreductase
MTPPIPKHPSGETMKAVCFSKSGAEVGALSVQTDVPKPFVSSPHDVLLRVHAASLNPIDKARVSGATKMIIPEEYKRSVIGYDVAGVVEQVGDAVTKVKKGDQVFARIGTLTMKYGALAEYVVDHEDSFGLKPSNLSFSQAAAVPLAGLTALQALRRGGVTKGSRVFIAGGAGGVGSLAIQIAKTMLGASYVCTTASAGAGEELCKKLGADEVIDYKSQDFATILKGKDFDMAFDTTGEATKMGGMLKKGGKIISINGMPTIEAIESAGLSASWIVKVVMFLSRNRAAEREAASHGASWEYIFMSPSGKDLNDMAVFLKSGAIKVEIDTEAPSLDEFKVAAEKLWSGRSKGKCVIKTA